MDIDAIANAANEMSSEGTIGALLRDIAEFIYTLLFPSNAEAATPVEIAE